VTALIVALGLGGTAAAQDRHGRDRNGQTNQRARERGSDNAGSNQPARDGARPQVQAERAARPQVQAERAARPQVQAEDRGARPQVQADRGSQAASPAPRADVARPPDARRAVPRVDTYRSQDNRGNAYRNDREWHGNGRYDTYRGGHYPVYVPYAVPVRPAPRHYYGPGGNFSVYFGWGSGYLFGAPYYGHVYGYAPAPVYGAAPVVYGDVRLQVNPRDAAVYVDGYYAGIVDNFDGVFQRLTLTSGPHQIELAAPGLEARMLNVYVDPARTIDVRMDLLRY